MKTGPRTPRHRRPSQAPGVYVTTPFGLKTINQYKNLTRMTNALRRIELIKAYALMSGNNALVRRINAIKNRYHLN